MFQNKQKKTPYLISQPQLSFIQLHTTTYTLRHTKALIIQFTRKLKTHTTQTGATLSMDPQTGCKFRNDIVKMSRFESSGGGLCA